MNNIEVVGVFNKSLQNASSQSRFQIKKRLMQVLFMNEDPVAVKKVSNIGHDIQGILFRGDNYFIRTDFN